jgi:plasmid stabilization system protein ParE
VRFPIGRNRPIDKKSRRSKAEANSYRKSLPTFSEFAPGSVARGEILPNLRTLHIARRGRRGRHFILYRPAQGQVIEVLRILHDAMEMARHIPPDIG